MQVAQREGASVRLGIESVAFQKAAYQDLLGLPELASHNLIAINVVTDKVSRAMPLAARAEAGKVYIVTAPEEGGGPWIDEFLREISSFPGNTHDDYVDAATGALAMVPTGNAVATLPKIPKAIMHRPEHW